MEVKKWIKRAMCGVIALFTALLFLYLSAAWVVQKALENGRLHEWLSESFGNNIDYEVVDVIWSMGTASIDLKQVAVLHEDESALTIPELSLHIDVFRSLFHLKLIFDQVEVKSLVLKLGKTPSNTSTIRSDQIVLVWDDLWPWIEPQRKIVIQDAKILSDQDRVIVQELDLNWQRTLLGSIQIEASAVIQEQDKQSIQLSGLIENTSAGPSISLQLETSGLHLNLDKNVLDLVGRAHLFLAPGKGVSTSLEGEVSLHPYARVAQATETFHWKWDALWRFDEGLLRTENNQLKFDNNWAAVQIEGSAKWDLNELANPLLNLKAHLYLKEFQEALPILSVIRPANPKLIDWLLYNVVKLPEAEAIAEWQGHLLHYPLGQNHVGEVFSLTGHFKDVDFYPDNAWPLLEKVSPDIRIYNDSLILTASEVHSLGIVGDQASLELSNWSDDLSIMNVRVQSTSSAEHIRSYLLETPLALSFFNYLRIEGPVDSNILLEIPLDPRPIEVKARALLSGNRMWLDSNPRLIIQDIRGEFNLINDDIQTDQPLVGSLLDQPLTGTFTRVSGNEGIGNQLEVSGHLPLTPFIATWIGTGFSSLMQGNVPFHLVYTRYAQTWTIDSQINLSGALLNPPKPYSPYTFQDSLSIHVEEKEGHPVKIQSYFSDLMQADIDLPLGRDRLKPVGSINILMDQPQKNSEQLQVSLHLKEWTDDTLSWLIAQVKDSHSEQDFLKFNLQIDHTQIYNQLFDNLQANFSPQVEGSLLSIDHEHLKGQALFPWSHSENDPIRITVQHAEWSLKAQPERGFELNPDFYPESIPAMNLNIEDLVLNHRSMGSISAQTKKEAGGVLFQEIKWKQRGFEAVMMGDWIRSEADIKSSIVGLSGRITSQAWESFLRAVGFEHPVLKAKNGQVDFVLTWSGIPYQFDIKKASGSITFDLDQGALLGVNPLISRFVDLMNISSLNTRLRLSGSDLKGDDLIFDHFAGQYILESGLLKTHNANLTGPTMDLTLIGVVDLNEKTLDQRVRVKPHLGTSIALVAGVLGGPIAGVATWVADKIVGNTLLKDRAIMYRLQGAWDNYNLYPLEPE